MLSKKLFRFVHKIALFAIVFASLAPSISHALQANNGAGFAQEVCSANGKKIVIPVVTTKGQQLAMEFAVKPAPTPASVVIHLEHCPFCAGGATAAALPSHNLEIFALLEITAQKAAEYAAPAVLSRPYNTPPSQAPPRFSVV